MMPLEDSILKEPKNYITYVKTKQKWYKKVWYFITLRWKKISKWQRLDNIKEIYESNGDFEIMEVEEINNENKM